jgi:hypothetical protein
MTLTTGGNVGVGTTTPSGRLHVANTGTAGTTADNLAVYFTSANRNCNVYIRAKNTESSILNFGDDDSDVAGRITYDHTTNAMRFDTNASERMRIDSAGLVGIGTSSPVTNLQVGASSDVGIAMSNSSSVTSGSRGTISMYNSGTSTVGYIRFGAVTDNVGTDIQFATRPAGGSVTERMRIDSSGNVGIGITTPTHKLAIGYSNSDSSNKIAVGNIGAYQGLLDYNNSNEVFTIENTTDYSIGGINFKVNGADRGFFDINGNFRFNSGYGSVATAYGCRAWVNFNGTGTPAIRASGNVSSITDNGTGDYTLNFTTAMPDANYSIDGSCRSPGTASGGPVQFDIWNTSSNRFYTRFESGGGTQYDFTYVNVAVFR